MIPTSFIFLSLVSAALHLPLEKDTLDSAELAKRDDHLQDLSGNGMGYYAVIEAGTPPQQQRVCIDTGSSDLWFAAHSVCNTNEDGTGGPGTSVHIPCNYVYDPNASSSMKNTTNPFSLSYRDGSETAGFYLQDTVSLAGVSLTDANFAWSTKTSSQPYLGVGFPTEEGCVRWRRGDANSIVLSDKGCKPYANLPQQLKDQGKISSTAYSIWLNELGERKGNILFGGVDHAKYHDKLISLPVDAEPGLYYKNGQPIPYFPKFTRNLVTLNQVTLYPGDGSSDILMQGAMPAVLDTGSTRCTLPTAMVDGLAKAFGAKPDGYGGRYVDCGVSDKAFIGFNFRGAEIQVPLRQFIRPYVGWDGNERHDADSGVMYCDVGANPGDIDMYALLGDNVLSSLYAVFDHEQGEIALAPAVFNQDESNVEDITDSIPSAVQAPAYSYNFTPTFDVNTAPTVSFSMTPITTITGDNAPVDSVRDLIRTTSGNNDLAGDAVNAKVTHGPVLAQFINGPAPTDGHGYTDVEGFQITRSIADGLSTVYTQGAPTTLGA